MADAYEVVNWQKFQHYKANRPAWIKAYVSIQDKHEYRTLPDVTKDAVGCLLRDWER